MAHLWTRPADIWEPFLLDAAVYELGALLPAAVPDLLRDRCASSVMAGLRRVGDDTQGTWALVVAPRSRVLINGARIIVGIAVLTDRDEIRLPDGRCLFFSTETLAFVGPFPASGTRGFCPRCKQAIAPASAAVRCPGCGLWHHSSDDFPCWTYGPHCAACPQDTALDAGFRWTPEEL